MNRHSLRSLVVCAGIAVPGVLIATTGFLSPLAAGSVPRGPEQIRLPASDTVAVCPGLWQAEQEAQGTDEEFSTDPPPPAHVQAVTVATSAPDGTRQAAGLRSETLAGQENFTLGASQGFVSGDDAVRSPTTITGLAVDEHPALVSAGQTLQAAEGDYAGLATLTCPRPVTSAVLTSAGTPAGTDSRLLIANPSQAPVVVELALVGGHGPITPAGEDSLSLQPGEQRAVMLGALAGDQAVLGVEVRASGGPMTAVLQHTERQGLTSLGTEYGVPAAAADTTAEVPLAAAGQAEVRVANPGAAALTAQIEYLGTDGPVDIEATSVAIPAHGIAEASLGDVPAGVVRITAEAPVVAGARLGTTGIDTAEDSAEGAVDFAEVPAVDPLRAGQLLVLPREPDTRMVFGAADGALTLTGVREDGTTTEAQTLGLSPERTRDVVPDELFGEDVMGVVVEAPPDVEVRAAAMAVSAGGISGLTIPPAPTGIGYRDIRLAD